MRRGGCCESPATCSASTLRYDPYRTTWSSHHKDHVHVHVHVRGAVFIRTTLGPRSHPIRSATHPNRHKQQDATLRGWCGPLWRRPSVVHLSTPNLAYGQEEQPAEVDCIIHTRLPPSLKARAFAGWRDRVHSTENVSLAAPSLPRLYPPALRPRPPTPIV